MPACSRPRSWRSSDPALAERLAAWRARQTEAVLDDPSNGRPARRAAAGADHSIAADDMAPPSPRCSRRWNPRSNAVLSTTSTATAATGAPVSASQARRR